MMKPISTFGQTALRNSQLRRLESELAIASQEIASGKKNDIARAIGSELINLQTVRNQFSENNAYLRSIDLFKQRADLMDGGLAEVESAVNDLVEVAAINAADALDSAFSVKLVAQTAIERIVTGLNIEIGGRFLFGGAEVAQTPLQPSENLTAGGVTPRGVVSEVITGTTGLAGFPTTDLTIIDNVAEADELLTRFDEIFQGANAVSALATDYSFENSFFNGEIGGTITDVRLPNNSYLRQNNEELVQGLRDVLQGAYLLASVELDAIEDNDGYRRLMTGDDAGREGALDLLSSGLAAVQRTRTDLGLHYQQVEASEEATRTQQALFNNQIVDLEQADPFETQTRFMNIERQLEASYAASTRVLQLSLFNFVR